MGWEIELIPDLPQLDAKELDKLFTNIMITAQSGQEAWANHKTLEACNKSRSVPSYWNICFYKN